MYDLIPFWFKMGLKSYLAELELKKFGLERPMISKELSKENLLLLKDMSSVDYWFKNAEKYVWLDEISILSVKLLYEKYGEKMNKALKDLRKYKDFEKALEANNIELIKIVKQENF